MYTKKGFPEVGEFVVCTVDRLELHSAFVKLDEYESLEGMIHASELSRKWVRNVKTYLKLGSKLVCKVTDVNQEKKHINLSVRRVGASQKMGKNKELKEEKSAYSLMKAFGDQIKLSEEEIYSKIGEKIVDNGELLFPIFLEAVKDKSDSALIEFGIDKKLAKQFLEFLENRLQIPKAVIEEALDMKTFASNGLSVLRETIAKAKEVAKKKKVELSINYLGAPKYKLTVTAEDFPEAEDAVKEIEKTICDNIGKNQGTAEFERAKI